MRRRLLITPLAVGERYYWPDSDPEVAQKRENFRKIAQDMWAHLIK